VFFPKLDEVLHELGFPARFLRDFQAAQRGELDIDIAYFACPFAETVQHL
jgi:hypothetical protein